MYTEIRRRASTPSTAAVPMSPGKKEHDDEEDGR